MYSVVIVVMTQNYVSARKANQTCTKSAEGEKNRLRSIIQFKETGTDSNCETSDARINQHICASFCTQNANIYTKRKEFSLSY